MLHTRWLRLMALLAVLSLLVAACGGDAETPGDDATDGAAATEEATGTEEPAETEEATEEGTEAGTEAAPVEGDGVLTIGSLLPETGSLAFLGPPEFAGVELAIQEINEAGGVLGNDVEYIPGDSGDTSTDIANQTADRLLGQQADVIVGAASSAVSLTVIDKITGAGSVMFSPANTSATFTDYDDDGLYFRTAPSDVLQGRVLAQLLVDDGNATVGLMALQDPYGEGLLNQIAESFETSGGTVLTEIIYDPQAQTFDTEVQELVSANPDAIVVIGFDESSRILSTMIEQGIGPGDKNVYGTDGNMGNALGEAIDASIEGMRGTTPGAVASDEFGERLLEVDPDLADFNYAPESYDAVLVSALAAVVAESDEGAAIAAEIPGVTRDGTECTAFQECLDLLEAGEDIDYNGQSGPIELTDAGDPSAATYQILEFNADNTLELVDTADVTLE